MDPSTSAPADDRLGTATPRLKPHWHAQAVSPDRVWLFSEVGYRVLESRLMAMLVPLIDGHRTREQIADQLEGRAGAADVLHGLWELEDAGYLSLGADEHLNERVGAFAGLLRVPDGTIATQTGRHTVDVIAMGDVDAARLLTYRLTSQGVRLGKDATLTVVLVDDYLSPGLKAFNQEALTNRRSWLIVKPVGAVVWCGPLFSPGATACWACLARRLHERDLWSLVAAAGQRPCLSRASLESTVRTAVELAATEVWKWVVGAPGPGLADRLVTFDTRSITTESHTVVRQPTCVACGSPPSRAPVPLTLQSRLKVRDSDGGYRCQRPDVTYERFKHHISAITGIVDRVEPKSAGDPDLVHIFTAPYTFARPAEHGRVPASHRPRLSSAGKGMTPAQARTGALCEAAERYAGIFRGDEVTVRGRALDLADACLEPNACMLFSDRQYLERDEWNRRALPFHWVPVPFEADRDIDWTPAWSLTGRRVKYVPTAYCYYGYPESADGAFCQADSNGSAAGANLEEAILQGFMELVERDAIALWWYNRVQRTPVDLESFGQPYFPALRKLYHDMDRDLTVFDISSDLAVPVFAAVSADRDNDLLLGFGAHFDPSIALSRSLTELNQFLPAVLAGRTRELFAGPVEAAFLRPGGSHTRSRADFSDTWTPDLLDDVERCVTLARDHGLETLVVDLTRPDVGLPVVKVIVPGLRPFWARFGPGRLYTVPLEMGWCDAPLREEDLNPAYILF